MLNLVSLVIGAIALILTAVAFLPLLGWMNWFFLPIAVVGLAVGAISDGKSGRNLNLVVLVIGILRLMLGGGIFYILMSRGCAPNHSRLQSSPSSAVRKASPPIASARARASAQASCGVAWVLA